MKRVPLFALSALLVAASASADDGPLVGKPLPELSLSHAVQGEPWGAADLLGRVVVLDIFYST